MRLHRIYEEDDAVYLVLDLLSGGELLDRIISVRLFYSDTLHKSLLLFTCRLMCFAAQYPGQKRFCQQIQPLLFAFIYDVVHLLLDVLCCSEIWTDEYRGVCSPSILCASLYCCVPGV